VEELSAEPDVMPEPEPEPEPDPEGHVGSLRIRTRSHRNTEIVTFIRFFSWVYGILQLPAYIGSWRQADVPQPLELR
jgi:hypothetical protein